MKSRLVGGPYCAVDGAFDPAISDYAFLEVWDYSVQEDAPGALVPGLSLTLLNKPDGTFNTQAIRIVGGFRITSFGPGTFQYSLKYCPETT